MKRMYDLVKSWYDDGIITTEDWHEFCEIFLEDLMKEYKNVLDRLKNI